MTMPSTRLSKSAKQAGGSAAITMPSCINKKLSCEICGKSFRYEGLLGRHRSIHEKETVSMKPVHNPKILTCNDCGNDFKNQGIFDRHRCKARTKSMLNNIESVLKSREASRSSKFLNNRPLSKRVGKTNTVENNIVVESALNVAGLVQKPIGDDSKLSRSVQSKKNVSSSANKRAKNSIDNQTTSSSVRIKGAIKTQSKKPKPVIENSGNVKKSSATTEQKVKGDLFTCKVCNKNFGNQSQLVKHESLHESSKSFKASITTAEPKIKAADRFNCKVCHKNFGNESRLAKHESLHDSSKPFSCEICGKFFDDIRFVKTHKTLHEKKSRKECEVCGKVFNERIFFEIHCLTHVEQKPFRCDICEDIFKDKSTFMRHSKGHKARTRKVAERFLSMKEVLKQKLEDSTK